MTVLVCVCGCEYLWAAFYSVLKIQCLHFRSPAFWSILIYEHPSYLYTLMYAPYTSAIDGVGTLHILSDRVYESHGMKNHRNSCNVKN